MHHSCDKLLRKMQGVGVSGHFVSHIVGGVLQKCYVTKRGYQVERDKLLRGGGGGGGQNSNFFRYVLFE